MSTSSASAPGTVGGRVARVVTIVIICSLTYCATVGGFDPWDIAFGALVGAGMVYALRTHLLRGTPVPAPMVLRRVVFIFPLIAYMLYDIVRGTILVTRYSIHLKELDHPGIVAVPLGERTRFGATMSGFFTTVAPGTFLVDFDWDERVMLIHAIDASDPDAVRSQHQFFYDRFQRHVFP